MLLKDLPRIDVMADSVARAIIYRKSETSQTEPCPFCGASHFLPGTDGHRAAICIPSFKIGKGAKLVKPKRVVVYEGLVATIYEGYILRTEPEIENSIFNRKK